MPKVDDDNNNNNKEVEKDGKKTQQKGRRQECVSLNNETHQSCVAENLNRDMKTWSQVKAAMRLNPPHKQASRNCVSKSKMRHEKSKLGAKVIFKRRNFRDPSRRLKQLTVLCTRAYGRNNLDTRLR